MTPQHMSNGSHQPKQAPRLLQGFGNIIGENSSFHSGKLGSRHRKPDMPQKQQSNSFLNQGLLCKTSSRFLHFWRLFWRAGIGISQESGENLQQVTGVWVFLNLCAVQRMSAGTVCGTSL